jgi:5,10-methenyltetrahydrofolate synthetase
VHPQALLVPLVGFDAEGYRLGYGAGYYDRTLASFPKTPITIGVGFELCRMNTIFPQPHDIPMDFVITEAGLVHTRAGH